jgi:hypothetical protein
MNTGAAGIGGRELQIAARAPSLSEPTVPAAEHLAILRQTAKRDGSLKDLRQMVAAWEAAASRCKLAFEELVRLAVFRLEVERDLGEELAQTVRRGGDRSRSPRVTLLAGALPDGITKQQAAKYRAMAAIPGDAFRAYLAKASTDRKVPTAAGARRFAAPAKRRATIATPRKAAFVVLPPVLFDAISRIMTADVCVGPGKLAAKAHVPAETKDIFDVLRGDVAILACPEPACWLPALQRLRRQARVQQVLVVLPAEVWTGWFRRMRDSEWSVCFLEGVRDARGVGRLVAHHGARAGAFRTAFAHLGAVVTS